MTTKKTTTTAKTKTKKPAAPKKQTAKLTKTKKPSVNTELYHPIFGVILLIVCCIMAAFLIAWGCCSLIIKKVPDSEKFASEYTQVDKDNVFVYRSGEEAIDILEDGTGIVFLGYPDCPWCQTYAAMLNDMAKEYGVAEIYYHDIYEDWQNNTEEYQKLTEILSDHLQFDNVGNRHLYVPDSAFVIKGEIIGNDWETSKDTLGMETPEDYWTEERVTAWHDKLAPLFEQVKAAEQ